LYTSTRQDALIAPATESGRQVPSVCHAPAQAMPFAASSHTHAVTAVRTSLPFLFA
jgi:hypothetical protein